MFTFWCFFYVHSVLHLKGKKAGVNMKTKILVIEDDTAISELICMNLEAAGYDPVPLFDGEEAEAAVLREKEKEESLPGYALALLDIMLPGKDGFQLMDAMQAAGIPVIYLTAKADVVSKVHGLRAGAEDYIVKPFEVLELLVRIEKVLQRTGRGREVIEIRDVRIDRKEHKVSKGGKPVALKPMEYELLVLLAGNKNVAFSREQLLSQVWGSDYMGETRTVDVHIGRLRKKLDFFEVIRTIPKTGYRLED
jgi:DNA-binding response OmpR family regulator